MDVKVCKKSCLRWGAALVLPLVLMGLFLLLRGDQALMDRWVFGVMAPVEQALGRFWALLPWSAAETLVVLAIVGVVVCLVRAAVLLIRRREGLAFLRRLLALVSVGLWLWCALCWMWNPAYYASSFTRRSGLELRPHAPQELLDTTLWFAQNAARLSDQVARDDQGHFAEDQRDYFRRGVRVYDNLVRDFPCLAMDSVPAKPLFFSRVQSIFGFTGVYFPFTGEANVNVDAPACLRPAVLAHEMSHQRMVASELEANFVGIAAAVTSDDVVFQYSGYLMGLIELSNALHAVSPQAWEEVVRLSFTPELRQDWQDNRDYWAALSSPVDAAAAQTYDAFLKSNDQPLGIASYGACVDLLITWFGPDGAGRKG